MSVRSEEYSRGAKRLRTRWKTQWSIPLKTYSAKELGPGFHILCPKIPPVFHHHPFP